MVELLVVIAIVTVLIALLLPAVMKAKRQAERIACASNMRQIAQGLLAYAYSNKDCVPAPGDARTPNEQDWIHWQAWRKLEESRIWPYIGRSDKVLRCPSGPLPPFDYLYSYALNTGFAGMPPPPSPFALQWERRPYKISQAYKPAQKVLLGEPDETGIFDSAWHAAVTERARPKTPGLQPHWLSVRHEVSDSRKRHLGSEMGRGNVIFADGHWEFVPRWMMNMRAVTDPQFRQEVPRSE